MAELTQVDKDTNIKVLVRVRPLLPREIALEDDESKKSLIQMPASDSKRTILRVPTSSSFHTQKTKTFHNRSPGSETEEEFKKYNFDESIWSFDRNDPNYTDNNQFYHKTGPDIIDHFFQGYNVCLLAYGQTSSGKTYTMMGNRQEPGLIPLIIKDILRQKEILVNERINCEVKFSYMEIYNEQVNDLLSLDESIKCRVREHPVSGPYVENVKEFLINDYEDFKRYLNKGNTKRSTAATSMNDTSSRSHAIITLSLKQTKFKNSGDSMDIGDADEEMISNIKLVDLAGSERLTKTKVFGQQDRMKEGTLINKSLTVLGRCINLLSSNSSKPHSKQSVVPYRDSILTYILKENLAGNSRSFMIFCVSPIDFEETYQTLNYANQVKNIKTAAIANKTKLATIPVQWDVLRRSDQDAIDSLKREVQELTEKLSKLESSAFSNSSDTNVAVSDNNRFDKLINFLDSETSKLRFENKYLKTQLHQRDLQISEMHRHINYIDREYESLNQEVHELQLNHQTMARNSLKGQCEQGLVDIANELELFDPKRMF
ncbi:P-loop containing nucleoside triphosphate hydrolase protein [Scheffersomyces xylosifermentans]|uniref:P-loop containing nucleoside triphosphate hydrolase protein n=1 Tax=Scheffersomyces xylosifermentans TaxID=1304137 RepID=UPI00315D0834